MPRSSMRSVPSRKATPDGPAFTPTLLWDTCLSRTNRSGCVGMGKHSFRMMKTNGITLRVVVEGDGPLLLLLHGFPQCWYLWRHQIDELVAAGYQVAVPDQRGYGGSDKPAELEAYDAEEFVADVVGIADALGHETFTLVTHDFGAVIGWDIAVLHPERVT